MPACSALAGFALFACLARDPRCLPAGHAHLLPVLSGIAEHESGFRPFAIRDEATGESLFPTTYADAVRIAVERDARGHVLGLGWFQITHRRNWQRHGLTVASALEPCANMRAGAAHFAGDLAAALSRYNSGTFDGAPGYAAKVAQRTARFVAGGPSAPSLPPAAVPPGPPPSPSESFDVWAIPAPAPEPAAPVPSGEQEAAPAVSAPPSSLIVELVR